MCIRDRLAGLMGGRVAEEIIFNVQTTGASNDFEQATQLSLIHICFGEYPDVVAYLLEIGLVKSYFDKVFVERVERKENKITVQFEKVTQRLFLAQDYFKALSATNLKAAIAENRGCLLYTSRSLDSNRL